MGPFAPLLVCIACYHVAAVLVQLPNTFALRLALLPVTFYSAFYTMSTFDATKEFNEPRLNYINYGTGVSSFYCLDCLSFSWLMAGFRLPC
jgi:hypothetical protein